MNPFQQVATTIPRYHAECAPSAPPARPSLAPIDPPVPTPKPTMTKTQASPKKSMPQRGPRAYPDLDLDALVVMTGVTMGARLPRGVGKWDKLFDVKLSAVGNAVYVPSECQGGIAAAALKRRKAAEAMELQPGQYPVYKVKRAGVAKDVRGIPDGTPISMVCRVA